MAFLTQSEWDNSDHFDGTDPIMKWQDVPQKTIFCVLSIEPKTGLKFESYIIHFSDIKDKSFKVYAPSHFISQIRRNRTANLRPYFVSHGLVDRGGNQIASFEISYKQTSKKFPVFEE